MYPYPNYQFQNYPSYQGYPQTLPQQQILQANGKASIDALKMTPNSSALIADTTQPIIWRCVSDSLGNVTAEPFDVTPHKEEKPLDDKSITAILTEMNQRITKLEEANHEQSDSQRNDEVFKNKEYDRSISSEPTASLNWYDAE